MYDYATGRNGNDKHVVLIHYWSLLGGETLELLHWKGTCVTYRGSIIPIIAISHPMSIFMWTHGCTCYILYLTCTHSHTLIHMQTQHAQRQSVLCCSKMSSSEVHAMWWTLLLLHSSTDFQAASNMHVHPLTLNSHLTRIINSMFQFHNAPQKCKQSSLELRDQRWRTVFFSKERGVKLRQPVTQNRCFTLPGRAQKRGILPSLLNSSCTVPSSLTIPEALHAHTSSFMKKRRFADTDMHTNRWKSHIVCSLLLEKVVMDRRGLVRAAEEWPHGSCMTFCNLMEWVCLKGCCGWGWDDEDFF